MILHIASVLAIAAGLGHSYLCERMYLRPLRSEVSEGGVFAAGPSKKLVIVMFHFASLVWIGMGLHIMLMVTMQFESQSTLAIYAALFAAAGIGNFWITERLHPGGVLLLSTAVLILIWFYN